MFKRHTIAIILTVLPSLFSSNVLAQYQLRTEFGDTLTCEYRTEGIFAVWWDAKYDHFDDAGFVIDSLLSIQAVSVNELGLQNPPNPGAGYYYNVYLHHGSDDLYPSGWGNGQGTDVYGYPFLTLPFGFHLHPGNIKHEGFHIFQYSANSPGFAYTGDAAWYIEASANWFAARELPDFLEAFLEAAAIPANPQMPAWRGFFNGEASDPDNWQRAVHQYGMNILLYYLTEVAGVPTNIIVDGFYTNTTLSPQAYLSEQIGPATMRGYFADWAAHTAGGVDYISAEQWARAELELSDYGDSTDIHDIVETFTEGTGGEWYRPGEDYVTRGWSYNVYKMANSSTDAIRFHLDGDNTGSAGGSAFFEGRVVVMRDGAPIYHSLAMTNGQDGEAAISVSPADSEIFFVIAATPDHFAGNQKYSYQIKIDRGVTSVENELTVIPQEFALYQNYPNPFNPETTIRYQLPESANVFVNIYNLKGQLVRTLVNENKEAGRHETVWDARHETGQSIPSGVYFYRIQAGDFVEVKKLTLLR